MVSNSFLTVPCSILGLGALFGGMVMQSVVLDFNVAFEVYRVFKLVPRICVVRGVVGLLGYVTLLKLRVYTNPVVTRHRYYVLKDRMAKI